MDALAKVIASLVKEHGAEHDAVAACLNPYSKVIGDGRTQSTILSTAQTQTDWLDSRPIKASLSAGAFDFATLKDTPTTVYLILPPNRLATHATWLRLMIASVLQPLLRSVRPAKVPVLMMLDEFAQMGHISVIENNMGLMREYGVKLWPILQDLTQLKDLYAGRWESFVGNAGVLQSFAPQDETTRDYLSKLSGQRLYWLKTVGTNTGQTVGPQSTSSTGLNEGWSNMQGPIYWPQGLAAMKAGQAVLFSQGRAPRSWLPDPSAMPEVRAMLAMAEQSAKAA
jgi:type IV secretion system protein VirD4